MSPYQPPKPKRSVKTADRIVELFVALQKKEYAGVTELANDIDLAKSTTYHYLATLQNEGYVVKDGNKYRLGLRFLEHATHVNEQLGILSIVRPVLDDLAERTGEVAWLLFEEHSHPIYLDKSVGGRGVVRFRREGKCSPTTAGGKAVLAQYSEKESRSIIEYLKERHPNYVIPDVDTYISKIQEVREQGYATCYDEVSPGVSSVAAPILYASDVIGAVSVAGPTVRIKDELGDTLPDMVRGATNDVELRLENESWEYYDPE
ncbi:IclR family transcriptional regulator [Halegenticoccus tardaugens]|uniref:IclR family transcriptional regulator n=1 Tax=Halegenticoccus tardaugens TaxID=2071624 RepID=UPI00100A80A5|nr:IclR family transcriptional regulator [Halegenticoccus tardaugens]